MAGTQPLEPLPAASQSVHEREAGLAAEWGPSGGTPIWDRGVSIGILTTVPTACPVSFEGFHSVTFKVILDKTYSCHAVNFFPLITGLFFHFIQNAE